VGDWAAAEAAFQAALADGDTGRALEGVGDALWWQGRVHDCVEFRERAYAAYLRDDTPWGAVRCALSLATVHQDSVGSAASASGWRRRARRLVDDHQLEGLRGWVLLSEAEAATRPDDGLELARQALACARARHDPDLELCALGEIGASLIELGEVAEGLGHLDEVMATALSRDGCRPGTTVIACCTALDAGTTCAAFDRVAQWVRAAERFTERYACPFLHVECRALYAAVLVATGDWAAAERELLASIDAAEEAFPPLRSKALATLAELRLAQGAIEEAERLVSGLDGSPRAALAQARVHLVSHRPAAAEAAVTRWLTELGEDTLVAHELMESAGEAELAQGHLDAAAARGDALVSLAQVHGGSDLARARGERLRGRARLATTDPDAARPHLEAALLTFEQLGMPFDTARTRLILAAALQSSAPEAAMVEAQAALATFDRLGARPGADEAAAHLRSLGVRPSREGALADGTLTAREAEVLELLGTGLSNPEIGERLYISRKTVEHHVGRILTKLGVRSRTEAAAVAAGRRPG
jgi:DNA-binding NarL/FixJ family response regulator